MKTLLLVSSLVLALFVFSANGEHGGEEILDPEKYTGPVPEGVPRHSGRLYEIHDLKGLVAYGDSLLVQISKKESRQAETWKEHEQQAISLLMRVNESGDLELDGLRHGRFVSIPRESKKNDRAYYYLEKNRGGAEYQLRALCIGRSQLYHPESSCFFAYWLNSGDLLEFTLDEGVLSKVQMEKLESRIFEELEIARP